MFGFSITTWLTAGAVIAGVVAGAYWMGDSNGFQRGREAALERSVDILRERGQTDDEIRSLDSGDLCRALGGEWLPVEQQCI